MEKTVSVIIPAYNEANYLEWTLQTLTSSAFWYDELIVIDDGSEDHTFDVAKNWTDQVYRHKQNLGKAQAIEYGVQCAAGNILVFLDADLGVTSSYARHLLAPLLRGEADMSIARLPQTGNGGFGLVKTLAIWGIFRQTGRRLTSPLSGQRAVRREVFQTCYQGDSGYGFEVGLVLDCLLAQYRIVEVDLPFRHRELGKTWPGFQHRWRQGKAVLQALQSRHTST